MKKKLFFGSLFFLSLFFSCKKMSVDPSILNPLPDSIEVKNTTISHQVYPTDPYSTGYDILSNKVVSLETGVDLRNIDMEYLGGVFRAAATSTGLYVNTTIFVKVNNEINYSSNVIKNQVRELFIKKQQVADQSQNPLEGDIYIGRVRNQDIYILFKITKARYMGMVVDMTFDCKIWK